MATKSHATYVIVALGTRGDVQPLACIAQQLRNSFPQLNVFLITHKAHEASINDKPGLCIYLEAAGDSVPSPPPPPRNSHGWPQVFSPAYPHGTWTAPRQAPGGRSHSPARHLPGHRASSRNMGPTAVAVAPTTTLAAVAAAVIVVDSQSPTPGWWMPSVPVSPATAPAGPL